VHCAGGDGVWPGARGLEARQLVPWWSGRWPVARILAAGSDVAYGRRPEGVRVARGKGVVGAQFWWQGSSLAGCAVQGPDLRTPPCRVVAGAAAPDRGQQRWWSLLWPGLVQAVVVAVLAA
jgi:hypothetical protein